MRTAPSSLLEAYAGRRAPVDPSTPAAGGPAPYDDMLDEAGEVRPAWAEVATTLAAMRGRDARRVRAAADAILTDDGVTYHIPGTGERRRWQLDPLPVVHDAAAWAEVESGVEQRAELLNLVLTDVYGPQRLLAEGLLPPRLVLGHPGYLHQLHGVRLRGAHQLFTYAVDLVRDRGGRLQVLSDRTQAPSGAAYALQNRLVTSRVLPALHRRARAQRLAPYFRALRSGLQQVAPEGVTLPRTVLLTPGSRNETAFEHAVLAARLGLSLVEGPDLVVQDGRVWLRALGRLEPVDVILRRVDQEWCDPLELRGDSLIGVPGLLQAVRAGTVAVVNTLGSGVLEDPALMAFLPRIAQRLLGQPLRIPGVRTLWLGEEAARREVLADLGRWVLKPVARRARQDNAVVAARLDARRLGALRAAVVADPHGWVAQAPTEPSSAPALVDSSVEPRPTILRAFAVADGDGYTVMPGGLTRTAEDPLVIANHRGATSKDTWVLAGAPERMTGFWLEPEAPEVLAPDPGMPSRVAENLFWLGRYAERAEGVVRLLREVEERRSEFDDRPAPAGTACTRALLQALTHVTTTYPGFVGIGAEARLADPDVELAALAGDAGRVGTLAHAIHGLLDCVDSVRDQLSGDTWLVVTDLTRRAGGSAGWQDDLAKVLHGLLAVQGLASEGMERDAGWHVMDAGRRLERSLQLLALLRATTTHVRDTPADSLVLESVLRTAESIITYRRRYRSRAQVQTVLDLLLLDPANPRALTSQLEQLGRDLAELPGGPGQGRLGPPERALLEATTALRVADTAALAVPDGGVRPALDAFLAHLQDLLTRTGEALAERHMAHLQPQRSLAVSTGGVAS